MEFYIGQTFDGMYPPEAAAWCNKNNAHIEKVDGVRKIVENPPPPKTKTVRTFAKDAIWVATKDMVLDGTTGLTAWEAFKTFLLESGLWEGWSMQAYLLEENPFFAEFYPKAVAVFGSELVDKVLDACVVESKEIVVG
jgi:hypothetical protein